MNRVRVERLIAGDVVLYGNSSWRILSIGKSTHPTKLDLLMEHIHGDDRRSLYLRATIDRDRVLQAIRLI